MKERKARIAAAIASVLEQKKLVALFDAIKADGDEVFEVIKAVKKGVDLNWHLEGQLPIECAILHGKCKRLQTLLAIEPTVGEPANLNATVLVTDKKIKMTYLQLAATLGQSQIVTDLLKRGLDPTVQDDHPRGFLAVHYAARSGNRATLMALNDKKQAINARSASGDFCLHVAAEVGKEDMVEYLLELGADINCRDYAGRIPLHRAAQRGQIKMVRLLLRQRTQITSTTDCDNQGRKAFHYAAKSENTDLIQWLVLKGDTYADCDSNGVSAMHIAAEKNKVEMLAFLKGKDGLTFLVKDKKGRMPIHVAAEYESLEAFNFLIAELREQLRSSLAKTCKPEHLKEAIVIEFSRILLSWQDEEGNSVIEYAIRGKAHAIIKRLIELGVNLDRTNKLGCAPMHEAAKVGDVAMMTLLNKHGLRYNVRNIAGQMPVHVAAEHGRIAVFQALKLIEDNDFNAKDADGMQPIHWASCGGQEEAINWLLANNGGTLEDTDKHGRNCLFHAVRADQELLIVDLVTVKKMSLKTLCSKKLTVMHHAVFKSAIKAISVLVKLGMSLEVPGETGILPFHIAVRSGLIPMVNFLQKEGVDINACNAVSNWNAWFYAAPNQKMEMLDCLDKHQVDLSRLRDKDGMTPMHFSALRGNLEAMKYFENKGLDCFAEDNTRETPLVKARKSIVKIEKEIEAIKKSATYQSGENKEEVEKCKNAESSLAGLKEVESYLMGLEAKARKPNVPHSADSEVSKKEAKTTEKRAAVEEAVDESEVLRPKEWELKVKKVRVDNEQEDYSDELASSEQDEYDPSPVGSKAPKKEAKISAKRAAVEEAVDEVKVKVIKPKKWKPKVEKERVDNNQEDDADELVNSDPADAEPESGYMRPKY